MRRMGKVTRVACLFAVVAAAAMPAVAQTEEQILLTLADQAHQILHNAYVTLPDLSSERIARSTQDLPGGWPSGQPKGLVLKEYIESAFLEAGLTGLDEGRWFIFRIESLDVDIVFYLRRDSSHQVAIGGKFSAEIGEYLLLSEITTQDCGDDDNFNCNCGGQECDSCTGPGSEVWSDTGDETEEGNAIMENTDTGERAERCGDDTPITVLAPL